MIGFVSICILAPWVIDRVAVELECFSLPVFNLDQEVGGFRQKHRPFRLIE